MSKWEREGAMIAGTLVREIQRATTWQDAVNAADAIFHVRLMQKRMEPRPDTGQEVAGE